MQIIESLDLPKIYPSARAIKSSKQNIHNYEPEFWEFFYDIKRYLQHVTTDELIQRYKDLCRNFKVLTNAERHVIPNNSFLSSWYWYLKEHQTRYEFHLRGIEIPCGLPTPRSQIAKPSSPKGPNSCDIIFRYGEEKYMRKFVDQGKIRISPASKYKSGNSFDPRTDDEINKHSWQNGNNIKITTQAGDEMPVLGNLKRTASTLYNYYTLCLSSDFEPIIFEEFSYDACVIIKNPNAFAERLKEQTDKKVRQWYYLHCPIQYFDPYDLGANEFFDAAMMKDFSYAYQKEYRFIWDPLNKDNPQEYIEVELGPLNDICELYLKN